MHSNCKATTNFHIYHRYVVTIIVTCKLEVKRSKKGISNYDL